jgi:uncharacterized protein (TIGR03067 family)
MRLVALLAVLTLVQNPAQQQSDLDKMQGEWRIVRYYEFSSEAGNSILPSEPDRIAGNAWLRPGRATGEYRLKLDSTKIPKEVDLTATRLGDQYLKGIYKFEGDQLFIGYSYDPALPRPTEFKVTTGERRYLYVLERVKSLSSAPNLGLGPLVYVPKGAPPPADHILIGTTRQTIQLVNGSSTSVDLDVYSRK